MMDSSYRRSARVRAEAGSRAGSWITRIQNSADTCADQSEASIHSLDQSEASIHEMDQSWASIHGLDKSEASIHGLDQLVASIPGLDQSWASIQGLDQSEASIHRWTNQWRVLTLVEKWTTSLQTSTGVESVMSAQAARSVAPVTEQSSRMLVLELSLAGLTGSGMETKMGWWNFLFRGSTATILLTWHKVVTCHVSRVTITRPPPRSARRPQ